MFLLFKSGRYMAYTFSPKICNTWEVTLDEARTQFYRQLYLQTFYIEIKFREESKGERNFSSLGSSSKTCLEIERTLSMNDSSNAINSLIEFADFHLLQHRAARYLFFFFISYANTVRLNSSASSPMTPRNTFVP